MATLNSTIEKINALDALDICKNEQVHKQFLQIYKTCWGTTELEAEGFYERESQYFYTLLSKDEKLRTSPTKFSIYLAFMDLAICGLTLRPGCKALCYLQGENIRIGEKIDEQTREKKPVFEGRLVLTISGYGELLQRQRAGQIRYADNPVLVYDNDEFSFTEINGAKTLQYTCHLPHTGHRVIAAYLRITRADGSTDYSIMFEEDWDRLRVYSEKKNRRWDKNSQSYINGAPNALYTSNNGQIDTGFLQAKLIKHAFRSYPPLRLGRSTILETSQVDNETYTMPDEPADAEPTFAPAAPVEAGVRVTPEEDSSNDDVF